MTPTQPNKAPQGGSEERKAEGICKRSAEMANWTWDRETGDHYLDEGKTQTWKVYKTAAGDYALTLHSDDHGFGGDVEFFASLRQAKREAEKRATA